MPTEWADLSCDIPAKTVYNGHIGAYQVPASTRDCSGDRQHDGANGSVAPSTSGPSEFRNTDVIEMNGIDQDTAKQAVDAKLVANAVHQNVTMIHVATTGSKAGDLAMGATEDKLDIPSRSQEALEQQIKSDLAAGKDVHIVAFSRGALVSERALEDYEQKLRQTESPAQVAATMSHVSIETYGGAGKSFPNNVRAAHYVDPADPVPNEFGKGWPNEMSQNVLQRIDGRGDSTPEPDFIKDTLHGILRGTLGVSVDGVTDSMYVTRRLSRSGDGTVIEIPARTRRTIVLRSMNSCRRRATIPTGCWAPITICDGTWLTASLSSKLSIIITRHSIGSATTSIFVDAP